MPKLTHTLPKYRKHRASGQAMVTLNGRDHYLGPHGTKASKREYDRLVAEWLAGGRTLCVNTPEQQITTIELLAAYKRHAASYFGKGPKSEYHHFVRVAKLVGQLYGRHPAAEFGPMQFKAVRQKLIDGDGSRNYINSQMRRLNRAFKWAAGEGMLPAAVWQTLHLVPSLKRGRSAARETQRVLPVSDATIDVTLPKLPPVVKDMVRLQRLTGMRPGELVILRPADIQRSGDVWQYRPSQHKTKYREHDRVVFLGAQAQAILRPYLLRVPTSYCFQPKESEAKRRAAAHAARTTPLNQGNRPGSNRTVRRTRSAGSSYTVEAYNRAIRRACEKLKIPHWTPNRLRHSAATEIRSRFGLEAAQTILGHSQANITQVYAERDFAKAEAVAREIG